MDQATVWVCLYRPDGYQDTADLDDVAEQVSRAAAHWTEAATDLAALADAGFELDYDSSERDIIDIRACQDFATVEEAEAAVLAAGVRGRILDFGDESIEVGEREDPA